MPQKTAKNQWNCIVLTFNQIKALLFQYEFKNIFSNKEHVITLQIHPQIIYFHFNEKYSYIFSAVISSGNNSSQSPTGLYNFIHYSTSVTSTCICLAYLQLGEYLCGSSESVQFINSDQGDKTHTQLQSMADDLKSQREG